MVVINGYQIFIDIQLDVVELRACPGRHKNRICNLEYIHKVESRERSISRA